MTTIDGTIDESQTLENWQEARNWQEEYKKLQADYTKKSQELSEYKKQPVQQSQEEEDEAWKPAVKDAVRDDIYRIAEEIADKKLRSRDFDELLLLNPDLKRSEKAIRDLSEKTWLPYEQVIDDYWFWSDKLKKAKERKLLGDREYGDEKKSVTSMSADEFLEWEKKNVPINKYSRGAR